MATAVYALLGLPAVAGRAPPPATTLFRTRTPTRGESVTLFLTTRRVGKIAAATAAATLLLGLVACSDEDSVASDTSSAAATTSATSSVIAAAPQPTLAELNAILTTATDPNIPNEEKATTVQGGETAPELFDVLAQSQAESGAQFQVVDPILPGYTPDSYLANVNFTLPDQAPQQAEGVEFIYENGQWKLSQTWACTLLSNTVAPEQLPAMCAAPATS